MALLRHPRGHRYQRLSSVLDDRDRLLGADTDRLLHLGAQFFRGMFLEDIEPVVGAHLEHLGRHFHASRIALAQIVVDNYLHSLLPDCEKKSAPFEKAGTLPLWMPSMRGSLRIYLI